MATSSVDRKHHTHNSKSRRVELLTGLQDRRITDIFRTARVESVIATFGWYFLSLLLNVVLPTDEVEGVELKSGGRHKYRLNGMCFIGF